MINPEEIETQRVYEIKSISVGLILRELFEI